MLSRGKINEESMVDFENLIALLNHTGISQ